MKSAFSAELIELIRLSREVALELRAGYVSTLHFLLADCLHNEKASGISSFLFQDQHRFQQYYEAQQAIQHYYYPDRVEPGDLPLPKEAERALLEALTEMEKYGHSEVLPAHVFLAAARDVESELRKAVIHVHDLYDRFLCHYIKEGIIVYPYAETTDSPPVQGMERKLSLLLKNESNDMLDGLRGLRLRRLSQEIPVDRRLPIEGDRKIRLRIEQIQHRKTESDEYAVQLGELEGQRKMLLELTPFEVRALSVELEGFTTGRSLTHQFFNDVLSGTGYLLSEVVFHAHTERRILAQVHYLKRTRLLIQDIEVPHAVILAVINHAPIFVAEKVFRMFSFIPRD